VRYLRANTPFGSLSLVAPGKTITNTTLTTIPRSKTTATPFSSVRTPSPHLPSHVRKYTNPQRDNWRELIPNRPEVMLSAIAAFRTHLALYEREGAFLISASFLSTTPHRLFWTPRTASNSPSPPTMPLSHQSRIRSIPSPLPVRIFITPRSVFDYNVATRESVLRKQQPSSVATIPRSMSADAFTPPRRTARQSPSRSSRAAQLLSMAPLLFFSTATAATHLHAVGFSSNRLSLLDRGVIYAIAHIRGGELGKPWHDAGRMRNKRNTFTDFISCAEFLIAQNFTSRRNSSSRAQCRRSSHGSRHQHAPRSLPHRHQSRSLRGPPQHHARRSLPLTVASTRNGATAARRRLLLHEVLLPLHQSRRDELSRASR